jgi:hypothetical protein
MLCDKRLSKQKKIKQLLFTFYNHRFWGSVVKKKAYKICNLVRRCNLRNSGVWYEDKEFSENIPIQFCKEHPVCQNT